MITHRLGVVVRVSAAVAMGILLSAPSVASAQRGDAPVPRDVVAAILRNYRGPASVEILRGTRLPDSIAVDGVRRINAQASAIGREICSPSRQEDRFPSWWETRPTLINPPGTGDGGPGDCPGVSSSGGGGSTRLMTAMSLDSILAHYDRQLADSGWTIARGNQVVSRTWTKRDSTGLTELTLSARRRAEAPGCVEVNMGLAGRRR